MIGLLTNKYVIFAIIGLGMGLALFVQTARLDAAEKEAKAAELNAAQWKRHADNMEAVSAENAATVAKLQAENQRIAGIVAENTAKYNRLGKAYEQLKRQTTDTSPVTDDFCDILNQLRAIQGGDGPACSRPN
jgi:uncharacterized protein HemX